MLVFTDELVIAGEVTIDDRFAALEVIADFASDPRDVFPVNGILEGVNSPVSGGPPIAEMFDKSMVDAFVPGDLRLFWFALRARRGASHKCISCSKLF